MEIEQSQEVVVEEGAQVLERPHVRCIGGHWQVIVGLPRPCPVVDPYQQPACGECLGVSVPLCVGVTQRAPNTCVCWLRTA